MTAIIDYGAGNLQSVKNILDFCGEKSKIISNSRELKNFDKALLPGVGAFKDAMKMLKKDGFDEEISLFIDSKKPFFGICLGLQLLFEKSYEFEECDGLGILKGYVNKFDRSKFDKNLKIPHIGWNCANFSKNFALAKGLKKSAYFYFVHSFHVVCDDEISVATTHYGYDFISTICKNNIFACQFHPEKSHENGFIMFKNFVEL